MYRMRAYCFHLTRCLLLHRSSGVICTHLHMRSDTDQAVDMCTVLHMCSCKLDRHNTCLFTCSAIAFAGNYSLLLPTSRTSRLELWAASTNAQLSDRLPGFPWEG